MTDLRKVEQERDQLRAEVARLREVRHGDPHMLGAVLGYELRADEEKREAGQLRAVEWALTEIESRPGMDQWTRSVLLALTALEARNGATGSTVGEVSRVVGHLSGVRWALRWLAVVGVRHSGEQADERWFLPEE